MHSARNKIFNVRYEGYADGSVRFLDDSIQELTGYNREEFNEKEVTWTGIIHPEDIKSAKEAFKAGLKGNKTFQREYRITAKSGDIKWILELGQINCNGNGSIKHILGILLDTTQHKMAEAEEQRRKRLTGKYLSFRLGREEFGVKIDTIKEICQMMEITPIPDAPEFVQGVVNLRGKVIPVVDLGLKMGSPDLMNGGRNCIIIAELKGRLGLIGVLADSVSDITHIQGEEIDDDVQRRLNLAYIFGMARTAQGVKILLDLNRMLQSEDLISMSQGLPESMAVLCNECISEQDPSLLRLAS